MQTTMPFCGVLVLYGKAVEELRPPSFEFRYHHDDHSQRGRELGDLMHRLGQLGFTCRGVPVRGICAFELARRGSPASGPRMIEFAARGADWLRRIVAILESIRDLNATRDGVYLQIYDITDK